MKSKQFINEDDWTNYLDVLSLKVNNGFIIEEKNDDLPFTVLSKENKQLNQNLNLFLCCITLGLWIMVWYCLYNSSLKKKKILIAIDEDGKTFIERCY